MNVQFVLLGCLLVLSLAIQSQPVIFKTYTVQDGLVSNQVRGVRQDSRGFIWIATWEGVSKYDGNKFTNFNSDNGLAFELINDIYEDRDGKLYIADNNGNIDYIKDNRVVNQPNDSIVVNRFIEESRSVVYAITDNRGILSFRDGKLESAKEQPIISVQDMAIINDSLKLVLNMHNEPVILDSEMKPFSKAENYAATSLAKDARNNIWICSQQGIRLLDPVQKRNEPIRYLPLPPSLQHPMISKSQSFLYMFEDADQNYWLSSMNGLIRVSANGKVQLFTTKNGLPTNLVTNLYQDKEKNIWMCSELGLVKLVMKNDPHFITMENGLVSDRIDALVPIKDFGYYINNATQLFTFREKDFQLKPISQMTYYSNMIQDRDGKSLLVTSNQGFSRITDPSASAQKLLNPIPGKGYFSIVVDQYDNYFLGTANGIVVYSNGRTTTIPSNEYRITAMVFDPQGYLWAGTWDRGLYRITITYQEDGLSFKTEDFTYLVPDRHIRSSFRDREGNIWIGTRYHGAVRISTRNGTPVKQINLDKKQGLSSNWISTFAEDQNANIWIGTHSGLNKLIAGQDGFRVFDFGKLNNFFGEVRCISPAPGNIIWCGTNSGLIRFRDDQLDTLPPPPLYLTSMRIGDSTHLMPDLPKNKFSIPYGSNQLFFEFSAPGFINEKTILYSYRLVGSADTAWSIPGNQHSISYASLQPGHYTFEVRAHGWNEEPGEVTRLHFEINPPFWQTWWFYLLLGLLIILLLYGIYWYRLSQWIKWQKARDRIATDLHDDIGSALTNISILSALGTKNLGHPPEAEKYLRRITEEVHSSSQAMDDIIWNVNSKNDTVEEILVRMRRFAAELFDHTTTSCYLELDPAAASKKLSMEQRRDMYLVYKESLNNIYKHAEARTVWVHLSTVDHSVKMVIRDDGRGFDPGAITHRNGLNNLKKRVEKWKGRISIHSESGKGSVIEIIMPVNKVLLK
ncbi:MAG TPA: two-component regulator propeller domain-containing protein [Chitinophagaceae bacterium]|nr:two-component regulator propeller domain-containing protein [Chitinophagaceae bacterium]